MFRFHRQVGRLLLGVAFFYGLRDHERGGRASRHRKHPGHRFRQFRRDHCGSFRNGDEYPDWCRHAHYSQHPRAICCAGSRSSEPTTFKRR